jgi:GAF domain-containing protein
MNPATSGDDLGAAYGRLLSLLTHTPQVDAFLTEAARLAADVISPAAACGITLRRNGRAVTVATSSLLAAQVDEIQYGADEGPCLDSLNTGLVVRVDDLSVETRWDRYRPHALVHGVLSSLSLPLAVAGRPAGAINLYSTQRKGFPEEARAHAAAFAGQCSAALTVALRLTDQHQLHQQLIEAMAARSTIDQALGILMSQQRCTAGAAFDLLRQTSQHRNRKLRDIAAGLITNVTGQPPQPPPEFHTFDPRRDERSD